jgi:hypothetical protein
MVRSGPLIYMRKRRELWLQSTIGWVGGGGGLVALRVQHLIHFHCSCQAPKWIWYWVVTTFISNKYCVSLHIAGGCTGEDNGKQVWKPCKNICGPYMPSVYA